MKTDLFAVIGHPVSHSLSPELFRVFLDEAGQPGSQYIRATGCRLSGLLAMLKELKIRGFNVTQPYKESILSELSSLTVEAEKIGAVNTVVFNRGDKKFSGSNTDYFGVLHSLLTCFPVLRGKKVLIAGAGGAARAAAFALKKAGAAVCITNRNYRRGYDVSKSLSLSFCPWEDIRPILSDIDILVWTIPAYPSGLTLNLCSDQLVFDANYRISPNKNYFGRAKRLDGLNWLIFQGWKSFRTFKGENQSEQLSDFNRIKKRLTAVLRTSAPKSIALIGFMGVGKSTIGRALAAGLGWEFFDTDEMCERETGKTIAQIFSENGEQEFRKMETRQAQKALRGENRIIALGGGAPCTSEIAHELKKSAFSIWLYQPPGVIEKRCSGFNTKRPLFSLKSFNRMLKTRTPAYIAASDLVLDSTGASVEEICSFLSLEIEFLH